MCRPPSEHPDLGHCAPPRIPGASSPGPHTLYLFRCVLMFLWLLLLFHCFFVVVLWLLLTCLFACLFVWLTGGRLPVRLSFCHLSQCLSVCLSVCPSVCMSFVGLSKAAGNKKRDKTKRLCFVNLTCVKICMELILHSLVKSQIKRRQTERSEINEN